MLTGALSMYENTMKKVPMADMLSELMAASLRVTDPIPAPHRRYRVKKHPKGYWFDGNYTVAKDPGECKVGYYMTIVNTTKIMEI